MLICGIDEAGRGSLLGPLVIGFLIIRDGSIDRLKELGVKDSKILSRKRRSILYKEISKVAHKIIIRKISAKMIDNNNINKLELDTIVSALKSVKVDEIYIDSFDVKAKRLEDRLRDRLDYNAKISAEHKADLNNIVVSGASIIAKVVRDREIDKLRVYGEIGSGYPSDNHTINFVKEWIQKHNAYPPFLRSRWKTIYTLQGLLRDPYQKVLD